MELRLRGDIDWRVCTIDRRFDVYWCAYSVCGLGWRWIVLRGIEEGLNRDGLDSVRG